MDFGFGEEQGLLRETTRRFLVEHQSRADLRRVMESSDPFDAALWRQGAALGWTAMLIPAAYEGGSVTEQPLVDLVVLAEELGRALNPGPLVPSNVVADAIARFGSEEQAARHLPGLARGDITAAWCLSGDGSPEPGTVEVQARPNGNGWRLDGVSRYVHGAHHAGIVLVVATGPGGAAQTFLVERPSPGLSERSLMGLDLTRRFAEVRFDNVEIPEGAELVSRGIDEGVEGSAVLARCLAVATVLQAAESVGAAEVLFEETVEYVKRRVQFGRAIGSFQAIKHRLAELHMEVEAMRVAAEYAALALGDGMDDAAEAVATAGAYVDDAFAHLCGEALQLHGGIGFTWEHDVHLFSRRAKVNQVLYGDGAWHREQLVRLSEGGQAASVGAGLAPTAGS
jgi:alkylation response protein AidB-like acyl-CoA dehydrogenase